MQLQELIPLLQQPSLLKPDDIGMLKHVVDTYPYFQPIHALYIKALKNKESYKYNNALKVTAAHTTDRSVLFDFITSEVFHQNSVSDQIQQNSEYIKQIDVNVVTDISEEVVTIDDSLKAQIDATEGVLDPNLFEEKSEISSITTDTTNSKTTLDTVSPKTQLRIGKPLEFDTSETHSFSEWLKITSYTPIERKEEEENKENTTPSKNEELSIATQPLIKKLDTIDKFLSENPKITPSKKSPKPKLVTTNVVEDNLMTETLARIYLEQQNFDKAITSYKILSLKYPEKSSFFADQIKAIEDLKEQDND